MSITTTPDDRIYIPRTRANEEEAIYLERYHGVGRSLQHDRIMLILPPDAEKHPTLRREEYEDEVHVRTIIYTRYIYCTPVSPNREWFVDHIIRREFVQEEVTNTQDFINFGYTDEEAKEEQPV